MDGRYAWAALVLAIPALLFSIFVPFGPFLVWGVIIAALLRLRTEPRWQPAVPLAIATSALAFAGALVGMSITFGTSEGPLASAGGRGIPSETMLSTLGPLTVLAPIAVLLAMGGRGWSRGLARVAVGAALLWGICLLAALLGVMSLEVLQGAPVLAMWSALFLPLAALLLFGWESLVPGPANPSPI